MRLTKKEKNKLASHGYKECDYLLNGTPRVVALNKFGQLEDIEEDFGVDLIKLLTAKTVYYMDMDCDRVNGKWRFNEGRLIIRKVDQAYYRFSINLNDKSLGLRELDFVGNSHYLDFSDYGKKDKYGGWAFTKEELE